MKILVAVKQVVDHNVKVRLTQDLARLDIDQGPFAVNPFDAIALEEAVRLKEQGIASEIVAVTVGSGKDQEVLRKALALGADRAIFIETPRPLISLEVAKCLQKLVLTENPALVFLGKQAIDSDAGQTGQMLAALLGWPQGTFASAVAVTGQELHVTREVDAGLEVLVLSLPAVVTADLRLNTPRYASLPQMMKAKRAEIQVVTPETLGVLLPVLVRHASYAYPKMKEKGEMVQTVEDLLQKLKVAAGEIQS